MPHFEHRNLFTTSDSNASHPAIRAKTAGFAVRTWPHVQVRISTNWPKWSPSLVTMSGGRGGIMGRHLTASGMWIARGYLVQARRAARTV
jgi:hypothetical protein